MQALYQTRGTLFATARAVPEGKREDYSHTGAYVGMDFESLTFLRTMTLLRTKTQMSRV